MEFERAISGLCAPEIDVHGAILGVGAKRIVVLTGVARMMMVAPAP